MSDEQRTHSQLMTAEELLRLAEDHQRHELVEGVLTTLPLNSAVHGLVAAELGGELWQYVEASKLGVTLATCGYILRRNPDTVRAADVSFVSQERWAPLGRLTGYPPYAPDLAVDIVDPWDLYMDVMDRVYDWLDAGTRMVLLVDPANRAVTVYRSWTEVNHLTEADQIDGADVVPGWTLPVRMLFE